MRSIASRQSQVTTTLLLLALMGCGLLLASCYTASGRQINLGYAATERGDFATAEKSFLAAATNGNYIEQGLALNNLGVVRQRQGFSDDAVHYYTLAARRGNELAAQNLRNLGQSVPSSDLVPVSQSPLESSPPSEESMAAAMALGQALGCALGGNCGRSAASLPPAAYTPPARSSAPAAATQVLQGKSCSSDYGCGIGYTCAKPMYQANGVCMETVNEYGTRQFSSPSGDSIGVRTSAQCTGETDCPAFFTCDQKLKMCVRL